MTERHEAGQSHGDGPPTVLNPKYERMYRALRDETQEVEKDAEEKDNIPLPLALLIAQEHKERYGELRPEHAADLAIVLLREPGVKLNYEYTKRALDTWLDHLGSVGRAERGKVLSALNAAGRRGKDVKGLRRYVLKRLRRQDPSSIGTHKGTQ